MNFWKEKEESGEGISNADDARHLVNEIDIIEDALAKIEDQVQRYSIDIKSKKVIVQNLIERLQQVTGQIAITDEVAY